MFRTDFSLLNKNLTKAELEKSFGSNTCRCTGYRPLLDTMKSFAVDANHEDQNIIDIEDLSKIQLCSKGRCNEDRSLKRCDSDWTIIRDNLDYNNVITPLTLNFGYDNKFYKVYSFNEIFEIVDQIGHNSYMLLAGNTAKGLLENFEYPSVIIDINDVAYLKEYSFDQNLILGANMTLEETKSLFEETAKTHYEFAYLREFAKHLDLVAHVSVRKVSNNV